MTDPYTASIWTSPTVGWELVTLPIVWQTTLGITIILMLINYKLKISLAPQKWQLITIAILSLFSFWFIEYIQETMWIYQPCYRQVLTLNCIHDTFISAIRFIFPIAIWGYIAFVLIPRFLNLFFNSTYKHTLIGLIIIYIICGLIYFLKLHHQGRYQIFLLVYEQEYQLASPLFSFLVALVTIISWPAVFVIQFWA